MTTEMLNYYGIIVGGISFLIIGLFHPLVIKGEYYFGRRIWRVFLIIGLIFTGTSLYVNNFLISVSLGVLGFSSFWAIKEVFEQIERVREGRFPKNPKRKSD